MREGQNSDGCGGVRENGDGLCYAGVDDGDGWSFRDSCPGEGRCEAKMEGKQEKRENY